MFRYAPLVAGFVLIVACAAVQGYMSRRWAPSVSDELVRLQACYDTFPMQIGTWKGEEMKITDRELDRAGARACISRTYTNTENPSEKVGLYLICGYSRDVAVHTPDACYVSAGYTVESKPRQYYFGRGAMRSTFFFANFYRQRGTQVDQKRIFWGWTTDGKWQAPDYPRYKWGGHAALNKVYLTCDKQTSGKDTDTNNPCIKFAPLVIATAQEHLFPSVPTETTKPAAKSEVSLVE